MSASDIADALITNLSAASVFGACQVATHFAVLERVSACCAVVGVVGLTDNPWAFQNQRATTYVHAVKIFIKDTGGNAERIERQMLQIIDTTVCSLRVDRSLQGNVDTREVGEIRFTHDMESALTVGGATWYVADGEVEVTEIPG